MTAHPHADLIAQYAQDAAETDAPHERWEECVCGKWEDFDRAPQWFPHRQYRRKEAFAPAPAVPIECTRKPWHVVLQPNGKIHKFRGTYEAALRCKEQWDARHAAEYGESRIAAFSGLYYV